MGDRAYTVIKAYFWIGARTLNHRAKIETGIAVLDEVMKAHPKGVVKIRTFMEYQYAESLDFFGLFEPMDRIEALSVPAADAKDKIFYALQYQEYVRDESVE